jgi:hypothetical protein
MEMIATPPMSTTSRTLVAVLILTFFKQVCLAVETTPAAETRRFVDSVGQHTPIAGLEVKVFIAPEGLLNYRATFNKKSGGPKKASIRKNSAWFIYAASSQDIWIYDGGSSISRIQFFDKETRFGNYDAASGRFNEVPRVFRDRLPERLSK